MNTQAAVYALALQARDWAAFEQFNEPARRQRTAQLQREGRHLGTAAARALVCCRLREHA